MDEIAFTDATGLAENIRNKKISSRELLDHYILRIEKYNTEINSIVCTRIEEARKKADEADRSLAKGDLRGPLHGVPMTVKESFDIKGLPTTRGDPLLKDNIATKDAVACERLEAAGAIIFGKTNVPIHLADFQSYNDIYGTTNNPWDTDRGAGGSSGGSAATLAAGMSGLELGSDIGGSIRNPAHYNGVFGLKSTWGILPMRGHSLPGVLSPSDISVIGPLARSARDLKLVVDVIGGADDLHVPGWKLDLPVSTKNSLKEYKIAVWADDHRAPVDLSVKERVLQVARLVEEAGGKVDYNARPDFDIDDTYQTYFNLLHAAMSARQPEEMFNQNWERRQGLSETDVSDLARVTRASSLFYREWYQYNERRTQQRWRWHEFFKKFDLILLPVCVSSAFPHDHNPKMSDRTVIVNNEQRPYIEQLFWAGITCGTYLPATVVPTGPDTKGLPIGVQIAGREMGDLETIRFAELVSEKLGGFVPPPAYED